MRYAILSDIHANRQAFQAVLTDIRCLGVDKIVSLGDLVGYGPCPGKVLEKAYENVHYFVLGNHDAVIAGKIDPDYFNDNARKIIDWTAKNLDGKAKHFFLKHPLLIRADNFILAHGNVSDPGCFGYIFEGEDALSAFNACSEQLIFVGHSHLPGLFVQGKSGIPHLLEPQDFSLEQEKRYIINPGSVGQPRDGDFRASYCVLDTGDETIEFRKIPFDIDAYRDDLRKRRLPEEASYFLFYADEKEPPKLRESLDFTPLKSSDYVKMDQDTILLKQKEKQLRKTQYILTAAVIITAVSLTSLAYSITPEKLTEDVQKAAVDIQAVKQQSGFLCLNSTPGRSLTKNVNLLQMPSKLGLVSAEHRLKNWSTHLSDPEYQQLLIRNAGHKSSETELVLDSKKSEKISISYCPIEVWQGHKFEVSAKFRKIKFKKGSSLLLCLDFCQKGGDKITLQYKTISAYKSFKKGNWAYVKFSLKNPVPANGLLTYTIQANFTGQIQIKECTLKRK